jgi:hypothetical protein
MKKILSIMASLMATLGFMALPLTASAATPAFGLQPFEFVGAAGDCGTGYPAGTDIVTAKWDGSTGNPAPSILLQKSGLTADCSAAGVDIFTTLEGGPVSALTELNYDYATGEHCGAGAPRFNIQTEGGTNCGRGRHHRRHHAAGPVHHL